MKKTCTAMLAAALAGCFFLTGCSLIPGASLSTDTETAGAAPGLADDEAVTAAVTADLDVSFDEEDLSGDWDEDGAAAFAEGTVITGAGTYVLTGQISSCVVIAAGDDDDVQLILDGVTITNASGPAIDVQSADKVTITLKDGTENRISDGSSYDLTGLSENADGAVFSKADLVINGGGSLTVTGSYKHGIVSKDDLTVASGTLIVTAQNVGLSGKDSVRIAGGTVTVTAGTDGIRSDNDEDAEKGFVYVGGGTVTITAGNDGIQAETALEIAGGTVDIVSGGGSGVSSPDASESRKGLKAGASLLISGGTVTVDAADDAVHTNGSAAVTGGILSLSSGDDGIHADGTLELSGGSVTVLRSYEGLEATYLTVSGGTHSVTASDDGLNAAGGNDGGEGGFFGPDSFGGGTGTLLISGGYLLVDSGGDGLDANGTLTVTGGVTLVSGPVNGGNGSLDYDGAGTVTGGTVIALGSSGMAMNFSSAENQGSILLNLGAQSAGTGFALCSEDGTVIASFTPSKAYETAVVTSPDVRPGGTYVAVLGGTVSGADENGYASGGTVSGGTAAATVALTSSLYSEGGMTGGMGGGFGGGPGGGPGRR